MKTDRRLIVGIFLVLLLTLQACAPGATPAPQAQVPAPVAAAPAKAAPASALPVAQAKPAWQTEWEKTLASARQEGGIAWAVSAGSGVRRELSKAFKDNYGLNSETIAGTAGSIISKVVAERRAGLYLWDVMIAGTSAQSTIFKPVGGLAPLEPALILPDLTDPEVIKKVWFEGKLPWVDQERKLMGALLYPGDNLASNTNLVKPGEVKTWDDLLNPKWKGKIMLMDPTQPGTNSDGALMPMFYEVKGEAWVRKLAAQEPVIVSDDRLAHDWLAHGKYAFYAPPRGGTIVEFAKAGAPVMSLFMEDAISLTMGPTVVSLIDRAPHPNAAKLFINYYLSKEGLTITSRERESQSARMDVPTDFLPADGIRKAGAKYWAKDTEEVIAKIAPYRAKSKEIFGHLIK